MKKDIIHIFCALFVCMHLFAQETESRFSPFQIPPIEQDDIWSVDFAPMFWVNNAKAPVANNFSFSLGLNYHYELNFTPTKRSAFAIGLGYDYTSLNHSGVFVNDSLNQTSWFRANSSQDLKFSRLNIHRLNVPVEFRLKFKSDFKLYLGYQSSFILSSSNKSKIDGNSSTFTNFSDLVKYQHGPRLRIGYKDVFIYSNFYLTSLFKKSSTISMQLIEVGISIGG